MSNPNSPQLVPVPRQLILGDGVFLFSRQLSVAICGKTADAMSMILNPLRRYLDGINVMMQTVNCTLKATLVFQVDREIPHEGYRLSITRHQLVIAFSDFAGAYYGVVTLAQLIRQYGSILPCLHINDWPELSIRGVMLDISRTKVPTVETLLSLIARLSELKINHLQLYFENAFGYQRHQSVWADGNVLTADEAAVIDRFCRERFVELVPVQNSFGHLTDWLKHPAYRHLAESPGGGMFPDGPYPYPYGLTPGEESLKLLADLYDELIAVFSSNFLGIGFDEPFDLGYGKSKEQCKIKGKDQVFIEFLLQVLERVKGLQKTPMFWADTITREYPRLARRLDREVIAMEWGYTADYPFEQRVVPLQEAEIPFILNPSTGTWLSFGGREHQMNQNIRRAALVARQSGKGLVTTDWGDWGHWQPLSASYRAFALTAMEAWNPGAGDENAPLLSLYLLDPACLNEEKASATLANIHYVVGGTDAEDLYFAPLVDVLWRPWRWPQQIASIKREHLDDAEQMILDVDKLLASGADTEDAEARLVHEELLQVARLLNFAITITTDLVDKRFDVVRTRRLEQWREILDYQQKLWNIRNKPNGWQKSVEYCYPLIERLSNDVVHQYNSLNHASVIRYPL